MRRKRTRQDILEDQVSKLKKKVRRLKQENQRLAACSHSNMRKNKRSQTSVLPIRACFLRNAIHNCSRHSASKASNSVIPSKTAKQIKGKDRCDIVIAYIINFLNMYSAWSRKMKIRTH